jgi:hypothetical protein
LFRTDIVQATEKGFLKTIPNEIGLTESLLRTIIKSSTIRLINLNSWKMSENNFRSLLISVIYVGIGTIAVLNAYGSSPLYGAWVLPTILLTLPVTLISFFIGFFTDGSWPIVIVQAAMFFLMWWLMNVYFDKNR